MGASTAQRAITMTILPPITADGLRRRRARGRRARLIPAIADLRVEPAVEQIDDQVDQREEQGEDQYGALDQWEIALGDRRDHQPTGAGPSKDRLGDDRPAEQVAEL